jgi:hypothetical protein
LENRVYFRCVFLIRKTKTNKMQLDNFFLNMGLAKNAAELATLLVVLVIISAIFWLIIGRFRLNNFLINIYISFALVQVIPEGILSFTKYPSLLAFLVLLIFLTLVDRYLFDIRQYGSGLATWQVFLMGFLEVVLLLSIIFSFLPSKDVLQYVSKNSLVYFIDPWWRVGWMVAPLALLAFIRRRN